ncbi:ATP-binding protein [bacterium]|nr:ATP-binding protein [bacterium]
MPGDVKKKRPVQCQECNDSGWIIEEKDGFEAVKRCDCFQARRKKKLLADARIPHRYRHCTLENFDTNLGGKEMSLNLRKNQVSLAMAREMSEDFVRKYPKEEKGLFFMGNCGVGKTHLAVAIIQDLIRKKGVPCVFYDFRDLLSEIKATYSSNSPISENTVLMPVLEKEILVLDELGAQKVTEWMRDTLTYIINQRYNEKRKTIITSNWLDEAEDEDDTLTGRIGYRLRSRLFEMCRVWEIVGEDYRRRE